MNREIQWNIPGGQPVPGCVFQTSLDVSDIGELTAILPSVWEKVREVLTSLGRESCDTSSVLVEVEIWPDTGRLIFILRREREVARVVVSVPQLEEEYFALPKDESLFDVTYRQLLDATMQSLIDSLSVDDTCAILQNMRTARLRIVARDSDDISSNRVWWSSKSWGSELE